MPKPIKEQVIVITGASSGIGLLTAKEAARQGARVVLAARNQRDLQKAAEEIRRDGGEAIAVPTDVTSYEQVEALARRAAEEYGRIDTWVNNAGVSLYATFEEASLEDFRRVVDVIFYGQVHGARAALPYLKASEGALICVGSALSDRGVPLQTAYCAAKHAIKGWLDGLRVELMKEGANVRVTLVKPSSINTPLFNKAKTQMGVMPMPIPPIYEPELAAEGILRAAQGNERDLFIGGAGKAMSMGERISPKLLDLQQLRQGFKKQKTQWPKSDDAPNNLFSHVEDDGGTRGDFTPQARTRSLYQEVAAHPVASPLGAAAVLGVAALLMGKRRDRGVQAGLLALGAFGLTGKGALSGTYKG
ncbi:MAG TPA: SDR family oxidoreductase [Longimicrobiaceae bacterium]|nr:SDR family oxidoreductase [Longimicrobiaceae bacterium]